MEDEMAAENCESTTKMTSESILINDYLLPIKMHLVNDKKKRILKSE